MQACCTSRAARINQRFPKEEHRSCANASRATKVADMVVSPMRSRDQDTAGRQLVEGDTMASPQACFVGGFTVTSQLYHAFACATPFAGCCQNCARRPPQKKSLESSRTGG